MKGQETFKKAAFIDIFCDFVIMTNWPPRFPACPGSGADGNRLTVEKPYPEVFTEDPPPPAFARRGSDKLFLRLQKKQEISFFLRRQTTASCCEWLFDFPFLFYCDIFQLDSCTHRETLCLSVCISTLLSTRSRNSISGWAILEKREKGRASSKLKKAEATWQNWQTLLTSFCRNVALCSLSIFLPPAMYTAT